MTVEFLDCLKRERYISIKAMSSGGKMAFRLNPPLKTNIFKKILDVIDINLKDVKKPTSSRLLPELGMKTVIL